MRHFVVMWLVFALCRAACAAPRDLLAGQTWNLVRPADGDATLETVPAVGRPGENATALRVTVAHPSDPFYRIEISQEVAPALPEGEQLRLHFWARSATRSRMRAIVEQAAAPYTTITQDTPTLAPGWKEYTLDGESPGYGPGEVGVRFQMGFAPGTIELAGIALEDRGPDLGITAAQAAVRPAAVAARIRKYRTGALTVLVRDARGRPVPGAQVHVAQTRHDFLFGCNLFGLNPSDTSPLQQAYQARFTGLFNYATLPFYWGAFEPQQGHPEYARLDAMARWAVAHGITPKGHPLVWHEVWPSWAPSDPDAAIPLLHQRVTDIVTHYKGLIQYWDVVNEANSPDTKTGEGAWIARDGAAKVVGTALAWARAAGRGTPETFLYNDYNTTDQNVRLLSQLQAAHQLPDVIGIQSHMHGGTWKPAEVWQVCQRFARFGLPIHFTETTVVSGPTPAGMVGQNETHLPWPTTPDGEQAQADYVVQFYTLLFSHPSVRAITWWDLSDNGAWQDAPAGLVRKDMTPKPAYDRLVTLIHKTWWTDARGRTDRQGRYALRAFYGDYAVTATDAKGRRVTRTLRFPIGSAPGRLVLTLP